MIILICDVHIFHYVMYDNLTHSDATTLKSSTLFWILHKKYLKEIILKINDQSIIIVNVVYLSILQSHTTILTTRVSHQKKLLYPTIAIVDDKNVTIVVESHTLWRS